MADAVGFVAKVPEDAFDAATVSGESNSAKASPKAHAAIVVAQVVSQPTRITGLALALPAP